MDTPRNYTRWTGGARAGDPLTADILGGVFITAVPATGKVVASGVDEEQMTPDQARMVGVRLIEAAALADGDRAIRRVDT